MDETLANVLFLFLGWLLGLLSPIIVDANKRRRENREVRVALQTELKELKFRLACVVYFVEMRFGEVNRKFLEWLHPIVKDYSGLNPSDSILKSIESQLDLNDQQINALAEHSKAAPEGGLSLKKYAVPLLESKFALLSAFDTQFQNRLMEIRTHLSLLNEEVDQARYYFRLTFDSGVTTDNHARAVDNLINCYRNFASRA
jgi:hypothetical protein